MNDNPYYLYKGTVNTREEWWWCHKCNCIHLVDGYKYFYACCSEDIQMQDTRSCTPEYSQKFVDGYNRRHNRILEMSNGQVRI